MKTIILNSTPKNWDKLENTLKEVQKGCRERTLDVIFFKNIRIKLENMLTKRRLPKNAWDGLKVEVQPFLESFAKAYKYTPYGTSFTLLYKSGTWRLLSLDRTPCDGNLNNCITFTFTDEQKIKMIENFRYDTF